MISQISIETLDFLRHRAQRPDSRLSSVGGGGGGGICGVYCEASRG